MHDTRNKIRLVLQDLKINNNSRKSNESAFEIEFNYYPDNSHNKTSRIFMHLRINSRIEILYRV